MKNNLEQDMKNNNNIYPDLPAIAEHYGIDIDDIESYQVWYSCFFVKIARVGWRFVSRVFTRIKVKIVSSFESLVSSLLREADGSAEGKTTIGRSLTRNSKLETRNFFRVIKTWDNGSFWYGDRVISVLVQNTNNQEKPWWSSVFVHQGIKQGDILAVGYGDRLVKTELDYGQAVGLY